MGVVSTSSELAVGLLNNFRSRRAQWGSKRAIYWQLMHGLTKLGFRLHYVSVLGDMRDILGEERPAAPPEYDTRPVCAEDMLPYAERVPDLSREFIVTAFGRGDICVANFHQGELVGFSFSSFSRARVTDQLDALVPDGFRYGYKAWTHPDHRKAKLSRMRGYVRRQAWPGHRQMRSINYVETHNYASLLHSYMHPRLRGIRMGFVGWVTVFGREFPFASRRARWIGFELVRKDDTGRRQYVK